MSGEISVFLKCSFLVAKWTNIWPGQPDSRAGWSQPLPGIKRFSALWPLLWYGTLWLFGFRLSPTELHLLIKIVLHLFQKISIFLYIYINSLVRRQAKLFDLIAPFMEVSFGHFYLWFCLFPWLCIELSVGLLSTLSCFWFTAFVFGAWSLCISLSREAGFL